MNVILSSTFGCLLGYAVAFLVKPPPQFFNFTVIMIGIGTIIMGICSRNSLKFTGSIYLQGPKLSSTNIRIGEGF